MQETNMENVEVLTKASMKVWLYSEVIQYIEMKSEVTDEELLEYAGLCSSISFCAVSYLSAKKLEEYRPMLMMDSFALKSIYYHYGYSQKKELKKWADACLQCAIVFRKFILDLSNN